MIRARAIPLAAVALSLVVACSGDDDTSSSSSGGSSSGGSSGRSSSSSSTSSGSSSTSKFSCKLNGACYQCPSASAVSTCAKDGPIEAGCTSADDDFCGG
ncbi:MAG: hypothetical protein KIS78_34875 [Labilithrix sp.]|nr:hypothetical protein [Labilithrix sp.]MCW5837629.1 hypothetical protein [Labilithrix sp.]